MKTRKQTRLGFLAIIALTAVLTLGGTGLTFADDHHFRHDDRGYWDGGHHYHPFVFYHERRGYWEDRGGVRVFIDL